MLFFSAIFALTRAEQAPEVIRFDASDIAGRVDTSPYADFEAMIVGNSQEAVDFREQYSHADVYRDGRIRVQLTWPSQAQLKTQDLLERRQRAQSMLQEKQSRLTVLREAQERAQRQQDEVDAAQRELDAINAEAAAPAKGKAKAKAEAA